MRVLQCAQILFASTTLVGGALVTVSCGNPSGQGNGCQGTGASVVITAQDNRTFNPSKVTISSGQSVCWQNLGSIAHTVTAVSATPLDSSWNVDSVNAQLNPASLYLKSFSKTNANYFYKCSIHIGMTGEIDVR
jgi:plastocyanin